MRFDDKTEDELLERMEWLQSLTFDMPSEEEAFARCMDAINEELDQRARGLSCWNCNGTGKTLSYDHRCSVCGGSGVAKQQREAE